MNVNQVSNSAGLYYEVYGQGDPILCLHGLGASLFSWRHVISPLAKNHKVILVDFKGSGKSPKPRDSTYSIMEKVEDIYRLILELDLSNLTLVGNSLGGGIALLLAVRLIEEHPGRLSKLVLIDSAADKRFIPWHLKLLRSFLGPPMIYLAPSGLAARLTLRYCYYDRSKIEKDQVKAYAGPMKRGGRHALLQTARRCVPENADELLGRLREITVPTLIIWGRQDKVFPLEVGELLKRAIPNSTLEVLDDCGHVPQEERPEETIELISRFLGTAS